MSRRPRNAIAVRAALAEMRRGTSAMDFMVAHLTSHPAATYEEVQRAAEADGHVISSATYGRARDLAGLPEPSRPKASPAMAFLVKYVKAHLEATYQEVNAVTAKEGYDVFPITYWNARRRAGIAIPGPHVFRSDVSS